MCTTSCSPVNSGWTVTAPSSVACGTTHTETCTNPSPRCGGSDCSGTASTVTGTYCSTGSCNGVSCSGGTEIQYCGCKTTSSLLDGTPADIGCYGEGGVSSTVTLSHAHSSTDTPLEGDIPHPHNVYTDLYGNPIPHLHYYSSTVTPESGAVRYYSSLSPTNANSSAHGDVTAWECVPTGGSSCYTSYCSVTRIDGECGTAGQCITGARYNYAKTRSDDACRTDGMAYYYTETSTWDCLGSYGGTDASCSFSEDVDFPCSTACVE